MESIYLIGSEEVKRAASEMSNAARVMASAAGEITDALVQFQQFMRDEVLPIINQNQE